MSNGPMMGMKNPRPWLKAASNLSSEEFVMRIPLSY
jgi:hypothetical protein